LKPPHTLLIFNSIQLFAASDSVNDGVGGGGLFGERNEDVEIEDDKDDYDDGEDASEDTESYEEDEENTESSLALNQLIKSSFKELEEEKEKEKKEQTVEEPESRPVRKPAGQLNEEGKLLTWEKGKEMQFIDKLVYYTMLSSHPAKRVNLCSFFVFMFSFSPCCYRMIIIL
jgi:hypothetical protein